MSLNDWGFLIILSCIYHILQLLQTLLVSLNTLELAWVDYNSGADTDISFWQPIISGEWKMLGQYMQTDYLAPAIPGVYVISSRHAEDLATPTSFQMVWDTTGTSVDTQISIWRAICPTGNTFIYTTINI